MGTNNVKIILPFGRVDPLVLQVISKITEKDEGKDLLNTNNSYITWNLWVFTYCKFFMFIVSSD